MVDDQSATFSTNILRQMKSNHEMWVSQKLAENQKTPPVQIRRVKQNIPAFLSRLTTGKEVLDLVTNAMGYSFDHEELKSQEEVDLVGGFLQVYKTGVTLVLTLKRAIAFKQLSVLQNRFRNLKNPASLYSADEK